MASSVASTFIKGATSIGALASLAMGGKAIFDGVTNPIPDNAYTKNELRSFPFDLPVIGGQTFCMMFQFYQYQRPSILVLPTINPIGATALPIPSNMVDKSNQVYDETTNPLAIGAALDSLGSTSNISNLAQNFTEALTAATTVAGAAGISGINNLSSKVGLPVNKGLQLAGVTQNPFLSLLYSSPSFKRHQFEWTFIPENAKDSEELKFITNKFRYHSMPDANPSQGGLLLSYPDMVLPTLVPQGHMYDFKLCMVESMSFDYAPGNNPAFTTTNAPNAMKFSVSLVENSYWTKSDLTNSSKFTSIVPYGS